MRAVILALMCLSQPALADLSVAPRDCPRVAITCFSLTDLAVSPGRPAVVGEVLVIVGQGRGPSGTRDSLLAVELDLSSPAIAGVTRLDATRTEREGLVEIAPDGATYALFTEDERDHLNRNRRVQAIQFFDENGQRLGRITAPYTPDWPDALEWSPGEVFLRLAGTNALIFAGPLFYAQIGDHVLSAEIATGKVSLYAPATADTAAFLAGIDRLFDPVGFETLWLTPAHTGFFTVATDGSGAALYLAEPGHEHWPDVLGYTDTVPRVLDPNPETEGGAPDSLRSYRALAVSPDWSRLAVLRLPDDRCDDSPVAYDVRVYDTTTGALVWSAPGVRAGLLVQDLVFARDNRLILTEAQGAVDTPCGPADPASPEVRVTIFPAVP
jgi:hypothetical protein